ncbi:hypothetical protein L9F63_020211, partial [Diploptera punctata]
VMKYWYIFFNKCLITYYTRINEIFKFVKIFFYWRHQSHFHNHYNHHKQNDFPSYKEFPNCKLELSHLTLIQDGFTYKITGSTVFSEFARSMVLLLLWHIFSMTILVFIKKSVGAMDIAFFIPPAFHSKPIYLFEGYSNFKCFIPASIGSFLCGIHRWRHLSIPRLSSLSFI